MTAPYWHSELLPGALEQGNKIEAATIDAPRETPFSPDGRYFISYRSVDGRALADEFQIRLRAAGLNAWRDQADLGLGKIRTRLQQALTGQGLFFGLAGGVIIATPNAWSSEPVRLIEVPLLLQIKGGSDGFDLAIANAVPKRKDGPADIAGPDQVLGLEIGTLEEFLLHDATSIAGREEIVRKLLEHRIQHRLTVQRDPGIPFRINVNTRQRITASETTANLDSKYDLTVRTHMAESRRWPANRALTALIPALRAMDDYLANNDLALHFSGSMHPSVALALGATFISRRNVTLDCYHVREGVGSLWSTTHPAPQHPRDFTVKPEPPATVPSGRILVLVVTTCTPTDQHAFDTMARRTKFEAVFRIELTSFDPLEAAEGNDLAKRLARRLAELSRSGELHLAFVGPWALAVQLGHYLNTVQYVTYEWDNVNAFSPEYVACLRVNPGNPIPLKLELPSEEGAT